MIAEGRLAAQVDQVSGVLRFSRTSAALIQWDESITKVCLTVNSCYDRVREATKDADAMDAEPPKPRAAMAA